MNCIEHTETAAVSVCAVCGAGLCKDCEANAAFRLDNKPLCKKCSLQRAVEFVANSQKLLTSQKIKMIVWLVFLVAGIILFFIKGNQTGSSTQALLFCLIVWGLASIGNLLKQPDTRSINAQVKDAVRSATNPDYMAASFMGKVMGFVLGYFLLAVSLPIQMLILFFRMMKSRKIHEENLAIRNALQEEAAA